MEPHPVGKSSMADFPRLPLSTGGYKWHGTCNPTWPLASYFLIFLLGVTLQVTYNYISCLQPPWLWILYSSPSHPLPKKNKAQFPPIKSPKIVWSIGPSLTNHDSFMSFYVIFWATKKNSATNLHQPNNLHRLTAGPFFSPHRGLAFPSTASLAPSRTVNWMAPATMPRARRQPKPAESSDGWRFMVICWSKVIIGRLGYVKMMMW